MEKTPPPDWPINKSVGHFLEKMRGYSVLEMVSFLVRWVGDIEEGKQSKSGLLEQASKQGSSIAYTPAAASWSLP